MKDFSKLGKEALVIVIFEAFIDANMHWGYTEKEYNYKQYTYDMNLRFYLGVVMGGGGGVPYNGLYGKAPPDRSTFNRMEVYKRVGISQAEV